MKSLGMYIHIPFCHRKCNYCDFYSVKWDDEKEERFIKNIIKEINYYKNFSEKYIIDTVYFGGGTPTIIKPKNMGKIIGEINKTFVVNNKAEISMEANPNTLTSANLPEYKALGINRLSIGIQSLNDDILMKIGRLHNSKEAIDAIKNARKIGFDNISADVMFNIPGQSCKDIDETINCIIKTGVEHISFYSLKLEEGTPMYNMESEHKITMPDEDDEREMYYVGRNIMHSNNIMQYEISNFAKLGYECRHNLKYWRQEEYIGLGPASHSFLNNMRYSNVADINQYCLNVEQNMFPHKIHEIMDKNSQMFEYIMLYLRMTEGMNVDSFREKFEIDFNIKYKEQIDYLTENNLIVKINGNIKLTEKGMDISNYVFEEFMI